MSLNHATPADLWPTLTDPAALLELAGPLTRDEAAAIVASAYERVEHLVTPEEMEAAPSPMRVVTSEPVGGMVDVDVTFSSANVARCLAWAAEREWRAASEWEADREHQAAADYIERVAVPAAHCALIRRCVRWPRP